jgi:rhodanese-related sulfurtransferase
MRHWTPHELALQLTNSSVSLQILDVREPWEYDIAHLKGSTLIPLGKLAQKMDELDKTRDVLILCHHGIRSAHAGLFLEHHGFHTINLTGGIERWARDIDHTMPLY